jgi:hypothetical protein
LKWSNALMKIHDSCCLPVKTSSWQNVLESKEDRPMLHRDFQTLDKLYSNYVSSTLLNILKHGEMNTWSSLMVNIIMCGLNWFWILMMYLKMENEQEYIGKNVSAYFALNELLLRKCKKFHINIKYNWNTERSGELLKHGTRG